MLIYEGLGFQDLLKYNIIMYNSIQIFACDHRKNTAWNLPYIRFGGPESDCAIKTNENKIFDVDVNADETPKLFWLWKNINELGFPDIIGYCQYRRFFTTLKINSPLINIKEIEFKNSYALQPLDQLNMMKQEKADGILHPHFKVINDAIEYKYIWDQIFILEGDKNIQKKYQKKAFDLLLLYTPAEREQSMQKAFEIKENYLCNIFTVKTHIFKQFGYTAFVAVKELLSLMTPDEKHELHPYWLAYVFERYTSCWYHALELSGKYKFLKIPLITIDAGKHIQWKGNS